MELRSIFADQSNILRSGWRFAIFFVAFLFLAIVLGEAARIMLTGVAIPDSYSVSILLSVTGLSTLIAALFAGWSCGKLLESLPFRAFGAWFTQFWLKHFVLGALVGCATLCTTVLIAAIFGGLRFMFNPEHGLNTILLSMGVSLIVFGIGAAWEEALFRGYILQTFNRSRLCWLAIILTSSFFGYVHTRNPNAGVISTINTILAGVWFAVAYLKTRDLWFVWGMHLMWNWMQGSVFGIEVSGLTDITTAPLLKEIDKGPTWMTGENYGIEGGIACTIAIIASSAIIYFLPILKPSEEMLALTSKRSTASES